MNREVRISVLETPRLLLRPLEMNDAVQLTTLLQDPEIVRWTSSIPWPYTLDHAKSFISARSNEQDEPDAFVWGMVESASNLLIGTMGLHDLNFERRRAELGYWIGEDHRRLGYTTEAAQRVISWAFETAGFDRIQATYLPGNEASAGVMHNIGMQREGLLRSYGIKNDELYDIYMNAVLRSDESWMSTAEQLSR